jgi:hypothetical protein
MLMVRPVDKNISYQGFWVNALGCKMGAQPMTVAQVLWYKVNVPEKGRIVFKGNQFIKESDPK